MKKNYLIRTREHFRILSAYINRLIITGKWSQLSLEKRNGLILKLNLLYRRICHFLTQKELKKILAAAAVFIGLPIASHAQVFDNPRWIAVFEDAAELNGLYDLATRAWQRMEPGDRDAIVAGWNGKRRHVPGLPLGQFAVHVKGAIGRHQVRGEAELAPLGFSVERGIGGSKRPRRMAAAAGVDGEKLAEVVEQLGLGV